MKEQPILVLGGNGKTGSRVAKKLRSLGHHVRIGSRSATSPFDWENADTWPSVLHGMDMVYITFQPDLAVPSAYEAIDGFMNAVKISGVKKVVLLSGKGEKEAQRCEQVVRDSGVNYTIVRATWFNQNFSESFFLAPLLAGHLALPKNEILVPYVDADDIADVVVATLLDMKHHAKTYQLTGPRALTFEQVAQELSKAIQRDIVFESISIEEYINDMRNHQVPEDYLWLIKYLFSEVLVESNSQITNDIEYILGRKAKDFSTYAEETACTGIWAPPI